MNSDIKHLEPGRPARSGQLILERRFKIVTSLLNHPKHLGRLLDIGCGNGAQTALFIPFTSQTVGFDLIPLRKTENPLDSDRLSFVQGSALELPFEDNSFEIITCFEVLEHLPDDKRALREMKRVLSDDGNLIVSVPNRWWIFETHGAEIPGFNWIPWNRIPLISWLPTSLHDKIARARIYSMGKAQQVLSQSGFEILDYGYITAPLDVLPEGVLRRFFRRTVFANDTTPSPFLAVNLFIMAR